jgi:hypothetical protein
VVKVLGPERQPEANRPFSLDSWQAWSEEREGCFVERKEVVALVASKKSVFVNGLLLQPQLVSLWL